MKKQLTFGRIVSYLLYLSLVCTLIFGVTYARYSTEVTGGASAVSYTHLQKLYIGNGHMREMMERMTVMIHRQVKQPER